MLPGTHPFEELEAALLRIAVSPQPNLMEHLREDRRGLVRAAKRLLPNDADTELILIIDQFEEVFTLVDNDATRTHFIDNLLSAVTDPRGRVRVILTLRADFYDKPLLIPRLAELMRGSTETVIPMSARELEQAILAPAEKVGVRLEDGLTATILEDVGEQPGTLPLLQYAMTELFERREGQVLTMSAYRAIGGVTGALARRADELYQSLDANGQAAVQQMFLRLITLGEGTEDTRRRALQAELMSAAKDGRAMEEVIDAFTSYRLLTLDRDPLTRTPTVEIAHEALIREWSKLREWLDESREDIRIQRRLSAAADEWKEGCDAGYLASGAKLTQFETFAAQTTLRLTPDEQSYLTASLAERERQAALEREQQEREKRLERRARNVLRTLVVVFAVGLVSAIVLSGAAVNSANIAATEVNLRATQQAIAEANFNRAEQQRLYLTADEAMDDGAAGNVGFEIGMHSLAYGYHPGADAVLMRATQQGFIEREWFVSQSDVNSVSYSLDGTLIAASGEGSTIVFDSATGETVHTLIQEGVVASSVFSPSGTMLLTTDHTPVVRLWDINTGEQIRPLVHRENVLFAFFSQDGSQVIVQTTANAQVWDVETGARAERYPLSTDENVSVLGFMYLPARSYFIMSDSTERFYIADAVTGIPHCTLLESAQRPVMVWWSGEFPYLVIAGADNLAQAWNFETCTPLGSFDGHTSEIRTADYDPNRHIIVSIDISGHAYAWGVESGLEQAHYVTSSQVVTLDISPDGQHLVMPHLNNLAIWDMTVQPEPRHIVTGQFDRTLFPRFSNDGSSLFIGGIGAYSQWDLRDSNEPIFTFEQPLRTIDIAPDDRTLAAGIESMTDFSIYLFDVATGTTLQTYAGHGDSVNFLDFSPDGALLASASFDATARVWDVASGNNLYVLRGHEGIVSSAVFSPDGNMIVTTSTDGTARLWDAATGEELHAFEANDAMIYADFSPDGRLITASDTGGFAHVWDVETKTELHTLVGHTATVWTALFSPDGTKIVTSSWDGTARIWDAATGETIRVLDSGRNIALFWAEFSPDGEYVVTGGERDDRAYVWRVDLNDVIADFCAREMVGLSPEQLVQYGISGTGEVCP